MKSIFKYLNLFIEMYRRSNFNLKNMYNEKFNFNY